MSTTPQTEGRPLPIPKYARTKQWEWRAALQSNNVSTPINQSSALGRLWYLFKVFESLSKKSITFYRCYGSSGKIHNFPNTLLTAWWIQGALRKHSEQESPKMGLKKKNMLAWGMVCNWISPFENYKPPRLIIDRFYMDFVSLRCQENPLYWAV